MTALVIFILVPIVLLARALTWKRRVATLGIGLVTVALQSSAMCTLKAPGRKSIPTSPRTKPG